MAESGCQQAITDAAEFNRLLIEENRRLRTQERTLKDQVLTACEQRDKAYNRVDQLKGQLQSAEVDLIAVREQIALEACRGREKLEDFAARMDEQLSKLKTERDVALKLVGELRQAKERLMSARDGDSARIAFWSAEAFRLAHVAGWSAFGTHMEGAPYVEIEFDGQDEAGEPLWERPVRHWRDSSYDTVERIAQNAGETISEVNP